MKRYEELTFTDDFMFCKIMQNNEDICKEVVELIIGKELGGIVSVDGQKPIEITDDGKGVRMDVFLKDDHNTVYNVEMQTYKEKNIAKRARYYQSMIDAHLTERGQAYDELCDSYIIFINMEDVFGKGLPLYTFRNKCDESGGLELGDGAVKIFLNPNGSCDKIKPELRAFLTYLNSNEATSDLTRTIETSIFKTRQNKNWRGEFMTLYEHYQRERSEGREEGRKEGRIENAIDTVNRILKEYDMELEKACELAGISVEAYEHEQQAGLAVR